VFSTLLKADVKPTERTHCCPNGVSTGSVMGWALMEDWQAKVLDESLHQDLWSTYHHRCPDALPDVGNGRARGRSRTMGPVYTDVNGYSPRSESQGRSNSTLTSVVTVDDTW